MSNLALHGKELAYRYGRNTIFEDLTVDFESGVTALLGPNGAGKTTLINLLTTTSYPLFGRVIFDGIVADAEKTRLRLRERIGFLPQHFSFSTRYTVGAFLEYVCWIKKIPRNDWERAIGDVLAQVDLSNKRTAKLGTLSGGMLQRIGIAQALVNNPDFIFLDEPTAGLDPEQRIQFREIVKTLSDRIVVISTHLTEDAAMCADRVIVLNSGKIAFTGTPHELENSTTTSIEGISPIEQGYLAVLRNQDKR